MNGNSLATLHAIPGPYNKAKNLNRISMDQSIQRTTPQSPIHFMPLSPGPLSGGRGNEN